MRLGSPCQTLATMSEAVDAPRNDAPEEDFFDEEEDDLFADDGPPESEPESKPAPSSAKKSGLASKPASKRAAKEPPESSAAPKKPKKAPSSGKRGGTKESVAALRATRSGYDRGQQTHRAPSGKSAEEILASRTGAAVAQGKRKSASVCCGRVSDDIICCTIDPRAHRDGGRKRLPGNWCLWCGDTVREGRSYCSPQCSLSYHEDVLAEEEAKRARVAAEKRWTQRGT